MPARKPRGPFEVQTTVREIKSTEDLTNPPPHSPPDSDPNWEPFAAYQAGSMGKRFDFVKWRRRTFAD